MATNYEYFSGANVSIEIENKNLIECAGLSYVVQSSSQPVYSYASNKFDLMLNGREMVQGNFLINYTKPDSVLSYLVSNNNGNSLSEAFKYYFKIKIKFGGGSGISETIVDCRIISRGQTIQISDQVLLEEYSFIGREIMYNT